MKELILSYINAADRRHLQNEGKPLSDEECKLIIGILQMILADASFQHLL
jgi:hypothetical protein